MTNTFVGGFQDTLVCSVPIEETAEHRKGLRKNLRGKWRKLVHKKQQQQDAYKIPAELRDQLKQIYVYWFYKLVSRQSTKPIKFAIYYYYY